MTGITRLKLFIILKSSIMLLFALLFLVSCGGPGRDKAEGSSNNVLHIIHAGSLTYPVKVISDAFREEHPEVEIRTEAWGSKAGARRVTDLETPADLFLSADYMVIVNMLIPEHASWYMSFAANEMSVVYTTKSAFADQISWQNWHEILLRPGVESGRSNPDHDPCGVRTIFTAKLAEKHYELPGLADQLLEKSGKNIRPKETDLIALLESGHLDYIFLYKSVAKQHKLQYVELPPEINLGQPTLNKWYSQVHTESLGNRPGETIIETGKAMEYGLTIPKKSSNPVLAASFVEFVMKKEKGQRIFDSLGQPPLAPAPSQYYDHIPVSLKKYARENKPGQLD